MGRGGGGGEKGEQRGYGMLLPASSFQPGLLISRPMFLPLYHFQHLIHRIYRPVNSEGQISWWAA